MPSPLGKVYQYELEGKFVSEYENVSAAAQLNNFDHSNIWFCMTGKYLHAHNFYWSYKYYMKLPQELVDEINDSKYIKTLKYKNNKIYQYDMYGKFVAEYENFDNLPGTQIDKQNVLRVLDGYYKNSNNFIWRNDYYDVLPNEILETHYRSNVTPIHQYDTDGKFIKMWYSISDAARDLNLKRGTLSNALNGIRNKILFNFIYRSDYYDVLPSEIMKDHIDIRFKKILQYDLDGIFIREWSNLKHAKKELTLGSNISSALTKKRPHAYGYIWKFKD
jgi:hypothetical protein